jgi:hypothetical protein
VAHWKKLRVRWGWHIEKFFTKSLILITLSGALAARGPEPGKPLPAFNLPDQNGMRQSFATLKGPKGLMLVFYRSADW